MFTVVMPKMGDTMEEGKILSWQKQEGDAVAKGDALAEVETEKVNIEAEAFASGVLRKILVPAGATVAVGTPIALVGQPSEPLPDDADTGQQPAVQAPATPAPVATPVPAQPVGATSGMSNGYTATGHIGAATQTLSASASATQTGERIFISPIARRIAQEHHLNPAQIPGSGPSGRIIKDDVTAFLEQQSRPTAQPAVQPQQQPVAQPAPVAAAPISTPAAATGEEYEVAPLSAMRKTIARRLQQSMQTAPHFYMTVSIDTTRLAELRATINEYAEKLADPIKVSYNDLIVKGVALALARMPQVNVSFDGEQLLLKKHVNVGVAVALDQGLIVPVLRDADRRGVLDIAHESKRLVEAARTNKLKPEEFQGGTFTVSNLGMFDVESFTAVINPPESAILAIGAIVPTPVVDDGQVVVRNRMKVTLSVDHRALDGATAARFLQEVKRLLESPMGLLV